MIRPVVVVRLAQEKDMSAMTALLSELYGRQMTLTRERWVAMLTSPHINTKVYVATVKGVVVGTASLARSDKSLNQVWALEDVVVFERLRGLGIGSVLVSHVLKIAKSFLGIGCIDVSSRHPKAQAFYERFGFEKKEEPFYSMRLKW